MADRVLSNISGVDFAKAYAAIDVDTTPENPGLPFKVLDVVLSEGGGEYIFATISGACSAGACCGIDESGNARPTTTANVTASWLFGWPQIALTDGQSAWFKRRGKLTGIVADGSTADTQLYTTTTAGTISTDASTGDPVAIEGVVITTAVSGGGAATLLASWPHIEEA